MKKIINYLILTIITTFVLVLNVNAKTYINLNDLTESSNKSDYTNITEYKTLDEFLTVYKSDKLPDVYITQFLFDGISSVKMPDLDDFVEAASKEVTIKTLELTVINIKSSGDYEFSGTIKGAMIAVNTNNLYNNINIYLNGANIDTDTKKAPVVYVYNKDKNYISAKVTIKTVENSKNYLEGGKLKKVSLVGSDELDKYTGYYSDNVVTYYKEYKNYYGIYTSEQIKNVLFATVKATEDDLDKGDPYYFYKASGAISSDIDLYFDGEGYLKVTSKNKEGIESKGHLSFTGGSGDYEIYAQDDCLNTSSLSDDNTKARNDIYINVNSLIAIVDTNDVYLLGDSIDSNGKLTIDGGTIYAFAHPTSGDSGLDSPIGTYINGGTIIATGNKIEEISNESKQNFIYAEFDSIIDTNTLIVIKDQNDNIITAFKTGRTMKNIIYSIKDLSYSSYKIYIGGDIVGEETNGLYTKIDSYTNGTEVSYTNKKIEQINKDNESSNKYDISSIIKVSLLVIVCILVIFIIISIIRNKHDEVNHLDL